MSTNMFLKFEEPEIAGSSTVPGHEREIEILSWNHGFVQPTSPTRPGSGSGTVEQATHQNLVFTKYIDQATNVLLKHCWSGQQIGTATLTCYRNDSATTNTLVEYLRIVMKHVILSNYSVSGGSGDVPVENIALDYGIIEYHYTAQPHNTRMDDTNKVKHDLLNRSVE